MYTIEVNYTTGDTETEDAVTNTLDVQWESKDEAVVALQSLKEHWVFFKKLDDAYSNERATIIEEAKQKEWFDPMSCEFSFFVKVGDEKIPVRTPWNGYFETLHTARVVVVENPDIVDFDSLDWTKL